MKRFFIIAAISAALCALAGCAWSGNGIKVRLYRGEAFRLTLDDFSFTFDGAGDAVKIDSVYGGTTDAGGNTYGHVGGVRPAGLHRHAGGQ